MKTNYKNNSNSCGVYKIINLINGKIYIGSAKNFKKRFYQHIKSLENDKHQNKHLQNAFNQYGSDNFVFEVIEILENIDKNQRFVVEQKYINEYVNNWEQCYNFKKQTIQLERTCFSKTPEETRKKQSERSKKMWQDPEYLAKNPCGTFEEKSNRLKQRWQENRKEMLNKLLEETPARKQHREKFSKQSIKSYSNINLVNPDTGEVTQEITNLREFCKNNNLESSVIHMVINGKINQYKGWHILGNTINKNIKLKEINQKICSKCKQQKSFNDFFKRADKVNGYRSKCKECFINESNNRT